MTIHKIFSRFFSRKHDAESGRFVLSTKNMIHSDTDIRSSRKGERGNVFFTLFGAVAVVGVLGAGVMSTMRGPLSTMVEVNRMEEAKAEMRVGARLILTKSADDDADGYTEAVAPTAAAGIPLTVSAEKTDPWGRPYLYCAWNHGPAGGNAAGSNRLAGEESIRDIALVIISSGPDRTFQTRCDPATDTDGENYIVSIATGNTISVGNKGAGDDLMEALTYDDAVAGSGGLWSLDAQDEAAIDKALDVEGGASFAGQLRFDNTAVSGAGLVIPTDASLVNADCDGDDPANDGIVRINTGTTPNSLELCDGGNAWHPVNEAYNEWDNDGSDNISHDGGNVSTTQTLTGGTVVSTADTNVGGDLNATGDVGGATATITGAVSGGSFTTTGTLNAGTSTLGATTASALTSTGTLTVAGVTDINNNLEVSGTSALDGNVTAGADLSVAGNAAITGTLGAGNTTVTGTLGVTGASTLAALTATDIDSSTLDTTGNVTIGGTLGGASGGDLEVTAGIKLGDSSACSGSDEGTIRYNGTKVQYCNGSSWKGFTIDMIRDIDNVDISSDPTDKFLLIWDDPSKTWKAVDPGTLEVADADSSDESLKLEDADNDTRVQVEESSDEDMIRFDTAGTERMIIDENGFVGIGTSDPDQKLSVVNGTVASDNLIARFSTSEASAWQGLYIQNRTNIGTLIQSTLNGSANNSLLLNGHGGNVGIGMVTAANSTALLDLSSTTQGFLPPRMTTAQRDAISSPATALIVYNTDTNTLQFFNGTSWTAIGTGTGGGGSGNGGSSMIPGWPDAIACNKVSTGERWVLNVSFSNTSPGTDAAYRRILNPNDASGNELRFNSDGTYKSDVDLTGFDCINKSIAQLYTDGQAFNFGGGGGAGSGSIVRGTVNADGTVRVGTGYTVSVVATGIKDIVFDTAFSARPTVVVTQQYSGGTPDTFAYTTGDTRDNCFVVAVDETKARIKCGGSTGTAQDRDFEFIVLDDITIGGGAASNAVTVAFKASNNNAQSIPSATWTQVIENNQITDLGGDNFDPTTGEFTAPQDGFYQFNGVVNLASAASSNVQINITETGGKLVCYEQEATGGITGVVSCSGALELAAGEKVIMQAYQEGSGAIALHANTQFSGFKINSGGFDVLSGLSCISGQVPTWNATDSTWECGAGGGGSGSGAGGTSMVSGWPDAIRCSADNGGTAVFYFDWKPSTGGILYSTPYDSAATAERISFNQDGTFNVEDIANGWATTDCAGKSIGQLYSDGQAFNFGGSGGSGSGDGAIIDKIVAQGDVTVDSVTITKTDNKWPDYVLCQHGSGQKVMYLTDYAPQSVDRVAYRSTWGDEYQFTKAGAYISRVNIDANCGASADDIESICNDDRCGFFGGGSGSGGSGDSAYEVSFTASDASAVTVPSATWTDVVFATEDHEKGGDNYNNTTGVFTAPQAGTYQFNASIIDPVGGNNPLVVRIERGDGKILCSNAAGQSGFHLDSFPSCSALTSLAQGDTVKVGAYTTNGTNVTLRNTSTFSGFKINSGGFDVLSGLSCTSGQVPVWNTTNGAWECGAGGGGGSSTSGSMVDGWPDAIICTENTPFYLGTEISTGLIKYYSVIPISSTTDAIPANAYPRYIAFNSSDGSWGEAGASTSLDDACENKSIAQLYADGQAFNFVGGGSGGSGSGDGPSFSVHRNGVDQTITASVWNEIDWTDEEFDTTDDFDLTTNRFTPSVAGKYIITGSVYCGGSSTGCGPLIRKNGTALAENASNAGGADVISVVVDMNGTTDYLTMDVVSNGTTLSGYTHATQFTGALIGGGGGAGGSSAQATTVAFNAQLGSNQAIAHNSWTDIAFANEISEAGGDNYDASTGKFTVPQDGYYQFNVSTEYDAGSHSFSGVLIQTEDAGTSGARICYQADSRASSIGHGITISCSGSRYLTAGTVVEALAYQNSGASLDIYAVSNFSGFKINSGGFDVLSGLSCSSGQVPVWNNANSAWECGAGGSGGGSTETVGFDLQTTFSVANASHTVVPSYTTESISDLGDSTYSGGEVTIGTEDAGWWILTADALVDPTPHTLVDTYLALFVNGVTVAFDAGDITGGGENNAARAIKLSAGDKISLNVFQANSGTVAKNTVVRFSGAKLSGGGGGGTDVTVGSGNLVQVSVGALPATNDVTTIVNFDTETDPNNEFDIATDRFQPTKAGKYLVITDLYFGSLTDGAHLYAVIAKNGAHIVAPIYRASLYSNSSANATYIVEMNGTTDYIEILHNSSSGSLVNGRAQFMSLEGEASGGGGGSGEASYMVIKSSDANATSVAANTELNFNTVATSKGTSITHSGTRVTLEGGKSYYMTANLRYGGAGGAGIADYGFYNATAGADVVGGEVGSASSDNSTSATAIVSPTSDTEYYLTTLGTAGTTDINMGAYSQWTIFELGGGASSGGGSGSGTGAVDLSFGTTYTGAIPTNQTRTNTCDGPTGTLSIPEAGMYQVTLHSNSYRYSGDYDSIVISLKDPSSTEVMSESDHMTRNPTNYGGYMTAKGTELIELVAGDYTIEVTGSNSSSCATSSIDRIFIGTAKAQRVLGSGSGGGSGGGTGTGTVSFEGLDVKSAGTVTVTSTNTVITDLTNVIKNDFGASSLSGGIFTVPAGKEGWYSISANGGLSGASCGSAGSNQGCTFWLLKNGSTLAASETSTIWGAMSVSAESYLNAGDTISIQYRDTTNGGRQFTTSGGLSLVRLENDVSVTGGGGSGASCSAFKARTPYTGGGTGSTTVNGSFSLVPAATEDYDILGDYDAANSVFTAPEDGLYIFDLKARTVSPNPIDHGNVTLSVNGTILDDDGGTLSEAAGLWNKTGSFQLKLDAGDEVRPLYYTIQHPQSYQNTSFAGMRVDCGGGSGGGSGSGTTGEFQRQELASQVSLPNATETDLVSMTVNETGEYLVNVRARTDVPAGYSYHSTTCYTYNGTTQIDGSDYYVGSPVGGSASYYTHSMVSREMLTAGDVLKTTCFITTDNAPGHAIAGRSNSIEIIPIGGGGSGGGSGDVTQSGGAGESSFRAGIVSGTIASSGTTTISGYTAEAFDKGSEFDTSTGVFTATEAGQYIFTGNVHLGVGVATANVFTQLLKNGSERVSYGSRVATVSNHAHAPMSHVSSVVDLAAGDTVALQVVSDVTPVATTLVADFSGARLDSSVSGGGSGGSSEEEVSFSATGSTTAIAASGAWTEVINPTQSFDNGGDNYDPTTGKFTAPSDGRYMFSATIAPANATTTALGVLIQTEATGVSGTQVCYSHPSVSSAAYAASCSGLIELTAGQVVEVLGYNATGSTSTLAASRNSFSGFKLSAGGGSGGSGSTVSSSPISSFFAAGNGAGTSGGNGSVLSNFATIDHNIGSDYDNSTGVFTAPEDGLYHFTGSALVQDSASAVLRIQKNGTPVINGYQIASENNGMSIAATLNLAAGDEIALYVDELLHATASNIYNSFGGYSLNMTGTGGGSGSSSSIASAESGFHAFGTTSKDGSNVIHSFATVGTNKGDDFDNASGTFTVEEAGMYYFSANMLPTSGAINELRLNVNGTYIAHSYTQASDYNSITVSGVADLSVGDEVTISTPAGTPYSSWTSFSGFKISGGSGSSGSGSGSADTVGFRLENSTQSLPGVANTTITNWTTESTGDLGDSTYNAGVITIGTEDAGWWNLAASYHASVHSALYLQVNGSNVAMNSSAVVSGAAGPRMSASANVKLSAGDTVSIDVFNASGSAQVPAFVSLSGLKVNGGGSGSSGSGSGSSTQIGFNAHSSAQSVPNGAWTDIVNPTQSFDEGGDNYDPATGKFTAPEDGLYHFSTSAYVAGTTTDVGRVGLAIQKEDASLSGDNACFVIDSAGASNTGVSCSGTLSLSAGDVVESVVYQSSGSALSLTGSLYTNFSGFKVGSGGGSGSGGSSSGGTESMGWSATSGQVIPNATITKLTTFSAVKDDFNAMSSGTFTVPADQSGWYAITANAAWNTSVVVGQARILVNGSRVAIDADDDGSATAQTQHQSASTLQYLNVGDTVEFEVYQSSGASRTVSPNEHFSIVKLGTGGSGSGSGASSGTEVAFSVHKNDVDQTVTVDTAALVTWSTEEYDTNSDFDTSTGRFTPSVAGKYQINAALECPSSTSTGYCIVELRKNGTTYKQMVDAGHTAAYPRTNLSVVVEMNGTTDYLEIYGTSRVTAISGDVVNTYFQGYLLGAGGGSGSGGSGSSTPSASTSMFELNDPTTSLANGAATTITGWTNTNISDLGDSTYSAGEITIGADDAGWWVLNANANVSHAGSATYMNLLQNGSTIAHETETFSGSGSRGTSITKIVELAANDVIALNIYQNGGSAVDPGAGVSLSGFKLEFGGGGSGSGSGSGSSGQDVSFSVHKGGTNQTVPAATYTKLTWPAEEFDTNDDFASDRFTPTVAGKYLITLAVDCVSGSSNCQAWIYKNGSSYVRAADTSTSGTSGTSVITAVIDMNGTTDYIEAYAHTPGTQIDGTETDTRFSGFLINGGGGSGSGGSSFSCPTGFTEVTGLGCMQDAEEGTGAWTAATAACHSNYNGRLPSSSEWYLAMANNTLTDETGNWEWLNDYAANSSPYDQHAVVGNTAITDFSYNVDSTGYAYRCFIPADQAGGGGSDDLGNHTASQAILFHKVTGAAAPTK